MNQLRILLVSLFACALITVAFLLQSQEADLAKRDSQPASVIVADGKQELAIGDTADPARENQGLPEEAETPKLSIRGIARDDLGAPITIPFRVFAWRAGMNAHAHVTLFEDLEGLFELTDYEEGTWHIRAAAKGHFGSTPAQVTCESDVARADLRLTLSRRPQITGVVVTPDGSPITKLDVHWETPTEKSSFRSSTRIRSGDEPGSFYVENACLGEFTIHAEHETWIASEPQTFTLHPGDHHQRIRLALREGGRIAGVAYDRDHLPAKNVTIRISALNPVRPTSALRRNRRVQDELVQTDDQGRFEAAVLLPGPHEVSFSLPSARDSFPEDLGSSCYEEYGFTQQEVFVSHLLGYRRTAIVEVADLATTHTQLNPPPAAPVQVMGKLTQGGSALSGYWLALAKGDLQIPVIEQARTQEDGSYSISLDQAGEYLVAVVGPNNKCVGEYMRLIPTDRQHVLNLAVPSGEIHGKLTRRTGKVARGQAVILTPVDGRLNFQELFDGFRVLTSSEGKFAFLNLPAGTYSLRVHEDIGWGGESSFFGTQQQRITLETGQVVRNIELESKPGGSLIGTALTASGDPIRQLTIAVRDAAGRLLTQGSSIQDKAFRIEGIPPGTYQITARTAELASSRPVTVSVETGQKTEVSLPLVRGTNLEIQTAFAEESWLSVRDEAGREFASVRGSNHLRNSLFTGGFSLRSQTVGPLAAGVYTIIRTAQDGSKQSKTVTLGGEASRVVELE